MGCRDKKKRILLDMVNVMLTSSSLLNHLWGEALYSTCHILNRVPYKGLDKTPYEI